jgi:hypothetical protein
MRRLRDGFCLSFEPKKCMLQRQTVYLVCNFIALAKFPAADLLQRNAPNRRGSGPNGQIPALS